VEISGAFPGQAPRSAVLSDLLDRLDNLWVTGQPLIDGWQLA
jgi:hypothetical protein